MGERRWVGTDGRPLPPEDRGLGYDLGVLLARRRVLGWAGSLGAAALLAACSDGTTGTSSSSPAGAGLVEVPDETAGPFPGDGSNGQDVLDDAGVVRSDIRASFGTSTTVADGVPMTIRLTVLDVATGRPRTGAAVYVWHCDRQGRYSMYSAGAAQENYLRGIQPVDATGTASFTSIFPACYPGRWPHVHFEVYASRADAISGGPIVKTSQLALPKATCDAVYATAGYEQSVRSLAGTSLQTDMVFADDGAVHQLATTTGDNGAGWTAALTVGA